MPLFVAMLDFLWTPGHLWGLAIKKMKEYKNAGVPMLPVKIGTLRAGRVVFWLNFSTVAFTFLFPLLRLTSPVFISVALIAGVWFIFQNRGLVSSASEMDGFKAFVASMPYLAILMFGLILDKALLI
jgi:heme o synthase